MKTSSHFFTLEELGVAGNLWVDFTIHFTALPAEPMVKYFLDGTGSPGFPASAELDRIECNLMGSDFGFRFSTNARKLDYTVTRNYTVTRSEKPEWFELLDRIIQNHIERVWTRDHYEHECLESLLGEELRVFGKSWYESEG